MSKEVNKNHNYKAHPPSFYLFYMVENVISTLQNSEKRGGCALNNPYTSHLEISLGANHAS